MAMECSMCGDVGFPNHLFQCKKCLSRFQHRYCSKSYFHGGCEEVCDWCFAGAETAQIAGTAATDLGGSANGRHFQRENSGSVSFKIKRRGRESLNTRHDKYGKAAKMAKWKRPAKTDAQARARRRYKPLHEILGIV